jgi:RimJ/RimL family protein N-acetyltransferase
VTVVIRRLTKAEADAWTHLRLSALADDGSATRSRMDAWQERIRPLPHGANQGLFVAEEEEQLVACGAVSIATDGSATIESMWTAPSHRGRGIATEMLRAIVRWAEHRGCRRLVLEVLDSNRSAQAVYAQAGFRRVEGPHGVDGDASPPVIRMELTPTACGKPGVNMGRMA